MRYFTKEWFLESQTYPLTENTRKKLSEIGAAYRTACEKEKLSEQLVKDFFFHDGKVSKIITEKDCTLSVDSPFSAYHTILFRDAVLKGELPPIGAVWLYEELYRHKSGIGYEVHILFSSPTGTKHKTIQKSDLLDLKILCREILLS